jgi:chromosome segregation ATPase
MAKLQGLLEAFTAQQAENNALECAIEQTRVQIQKAETNLSREREREAGWKAELNELSHKIIGLQETAKSLEAVIAKEKRDKNVVYLNLVNVESQAKKLTQMQTDMMSGHISELELQFDTYIAKRKAYADQLQELTVTQDSKADDDAAPADTAGGNATTTTDLAQEEASNGESDNAMDIE